MFDFKPPLVATILVVICITRHIFGTEKEDAVERCKEIVMKEDVFFEDENNGYENFKRAFKYVSLPELDIKLGEPTDREETVQENRERGLQYELTSSYFLDLFKHHGINVSQMENPYRWCHNVTYNAKPLKVFKMVIKHPFTDCMAFTTKMLKNPDNLEDPAHIFKSMYENWSLNNLMSELGSLNNLMSGSVSLNNLMRELGFTKEQFDSENKKLELETKMQKNVRSYTMEYFNYYSKVLDNPDIDPDNFRSIQKYCEEEGYLTVIDLG